MIYTLTHDPKKRAMLLMVIYAVLLSIGGIFIKLISCNPLLIAGGRSIFSALLVAGFMKYRKIPVKFTRYSVAAGVGLGISSILFVTANKLTTAANAIVLQYAAPVFILLISAVLFGQKIKKREIIVVACTMAGIVLFFFDQISPGSILGNITAILSGFFLAIMFVMVGQGGDDDSVRMSGILFAHCLTVVIGFPAGAVMTESITGTEIMLIIFLGLFQLGIPYILYAIAAKDCPPLACSLIAMLEPMLNPTWVAIFAGEIPGIFAFIGAAIIIGTVTWWCITGNDTEKEEVN